MHSKNLYQQNLDSYTIGFIVLNAAANFYESLLHIVNKIKQGLSGKAKVKLMLIE